MSDVYPIDPLGNYRVPPPPSFDGAPVSVAVDDGAGPSFDQGTGTLQIPQSDGSLLISFEEPGPEAPPDTDFDDNLAEVMDASHLSAVAERLLRGIAQDDRSRDEWLKNMEGGLRLLGLEVKIPQGASAAATTPAEGISTIDSPLLLEAVLRFQANARAELLPADGPVKTRIDGASTAITQELAEALQKDLNHYLTVVADEYYPDTDKMLFLLGFGGIGFKKGFHDPIKRRPVIQSIAAKDLIVSNASTTLEGAGRVTHRIFMRPSMIKRMQMVGAYRKVPMAQTAPITDKNPVDSKIEQIQGVAPPSYVEFPEDQDRELYETYCEIDLPGFEHEEEDGEVSGLPLPYKVVLDKDSRQVLEIRRNWDEADPLFMPINRIVAYIFVPGLGFYGIGLLNIIGNTTKAMTAAWRLMLDSGMYSNFPGFLYLKQLGRQMTNQFRVAPGQGQPIDAPGSTDIRQVIMPLPYKDPSAIFIQLCQSLQSDAQRVGGTAELQVGEGKQDAPVGTTLALIEQATKIMSAVHKRLHQNQTQEFAMLRGLLMEDPEALWRHNKKSAVLAFYAAQANVDVAAMMQQMAADECVHRQKFLAALADVSLIPAADPNTSSQTERYLKIMALRQMAATNPALDMVAIDKRALKILGVDDGDSLFKPPPPPGAPPPPNPEQTLADAAQATAAARMADARNRQAESQLRLQSAREERASREKIASLQVARQVAISQHEAQLAQNRMDREDRNRNADRSQDLGLADLNNRAKFYTQASSNRVKLLTHAASLHHQATQGIASRTHEALQNHLDRSQSGVDQGGT